MHIFTRPANLSTLNIEIIICMLLRQSYTYVVSARGRFYIGSRLCPLNIVPELDTKYVGSPRDLKFKRIPRGEKKKRILSTFLTRYDALKHEIILHDQFDVAKNPKFVNQAKQSSTGFSYNTAGENHYMYGKHHSPETRHKQSEAKRGKNHHMYGKHHSPETLHKLSKAKKGKYVAENSSKFDHTLRDWIHDIHGEKLQITNYHIAQEYGLYSSGFSRVARGIRKSYHGWRLLCN